MSERLKIRICPPIGICMSASRPNQALFQRSSNNIVLRYASVLALLVVAVWLVPDVGTVLLLALALYSFRGERAAVQAVTVAWLLTGLAPRAQGTLLIVTARPAAASDLALDLPILDPRLDWEVSGQVPNVVFPSGLTVTGTGDKALLNLYYGAADTVIGRATAPLAEILAACI